MSRRAQTFDWYCMCMLRRCIHCVTLTLSSSMLLAASWRVVSSLLESSLTQSSRTEARSATTDAFSARADCSSSSSRDVARTRDDTWASYACSAFMCYTHRQRQSSKEWKWRSYLRTQTNDYLLKSVTPLQKRTVYKINTNLYLSWNTTCNLYTFCTEAPQFR